MQPRSVQVTVLAVEVAAVVLVLTRTGDATPTAAAIGIRLVLAVLGVVHTELAVGVERSG